MKEDWLTSRNAAELLSGRGTNALPVLLQALKHKSPHTQLLATEALTAFATVPESHSQALTELLQVLRNPNALLRRRAAEALSAYAANPIDTDGLILALFDSLENDKDHVVRQCAAQTLGQLKVSTKNQSAVQTQIIPKLAQLTAKQIPLVKVELAYAILKLIGQLKMLFQESGKENQVPQDQFEKQALRVLVSTLQDAHDPWLQASTARTLGELKATATPAIPALLTALQSSDAAVYHNAAAALGQIGEMVFVPLKKALEDRSPAIRRRAAYALGQMNHAVNDSLHALERTLAHDKDTSVKDAAQFAHKILKIRHKR